MKEKPPPPYKGKVVATPLSLVAAVSVQATAASVIIVEAPFAAAASVASLMEQPLWEGSPAGEESM